MGKNIANPKYNVLSIRVTDEEKAILDEMRRYTQKSISFLIREALFRYSPNEDLT
jgi:predicted transcriptional regulator